MNRNDWNDGAAFAAETPRLRIRPLAATDQSLYCSLYTDAVTMRFIGAPLSPERALRGFSAALARMRRDPTGHLFLALVDKASGEPIGICSLQQLDTRRRAAEAGIILRPAAHARGYAKEGFGALLNLAFARWPVDEIRVQFSVDHLAAGRVAAGLGLSRCVGAAAGNDDEGRQVWSAHRKSWCHNVASQ